MGSARGHPIPRSIATLSAFQLAPPLCIGIVSYGHAELPLEASVPAICISLTVAAGMALLADLLAVKVRATTDELALQLGGSTSRTSC